MDPRDKLAHWATCISEHQVQSRDPFTVNKVESDRRHPVLPSDPHMHTHMHVPTGEVIHTHVSTHTHTIHKPTQEEEFYVCLSGTFNNSRIHNLNYAI